MTTDSGRQEPKGAHDARKAVEAENVEKADSLHPVEEPSAASGIDPQEIAALAYQYWEERGRPEPSAEQDWSRAEQTLRSQVGDRNDA